MKYVLLFCGDVLRRDVRYRERAAAVSFPVRQADDDDRLMLIFTCCHPALSREAQVALTLRTVCGLSTAERSAARSWSRRRRSSSG